KDANAAGKKMCEDDSVEKLHRGVWRDQCKQEHGRGEDQGLRICNRRMAAEKIGVPKRNLTIVQSIAQETEHRIKMVFRIPWHDRSGEEPRGQCEPVKEEEA